MYILSNLNISNRSNNLSIVRTIAAISVVFCHALVLDDGKTYDVLGLFNSGLFGQLAVAVFFGLSGFLITQSYEKSKSPSKFMEARVLRIFPGLIYTTVLTILLVCLFGNKMPGFRYAGEFFYKSLKMSLDSMGDYFISNPFNAVNGSLWTLETEFKYYIVTMGLGWIGLSSRRYWLLLLAAVVSILYAQGNVIGSVFFDYVLGVGPTAGEAYLNLAACFFFGMMAFHFKEYVPISIVVAVVLLSANWFFSNWALQSLTWTYAAFVVGFHPKLYISRLRDIDDLSYGIYITSFPIQQLLVMNFSGLKGYSLFFVSLALTIIASWISWRYVEERALQYRGRFFKAVRKRFSRKVATVSN